MERVIEMLYLFNRHKPDYEIDIVGNLVETPEEIYQIVEDHRKAMEELNKNVEALRQIVSKSEKEIH